MLHRYDDAPLAEIDVALPRQIDGLAGVRMMVGRGEMVMVIGREVKLQCKESATSYTVKVYLPEEVAV